MGKLRKQTKTLQLNQANAKGGEQHGANKKNSSTVAYVQILGTGMDTQDTSPSVLLFFDNLRFIFNAGEGLQRFCAEHKIKLSKIDHICLSRVCSETAGGLPGLLLTLAGLGEGVSVNIWGPPNLELLVDSMKSYIPRSAIVHKDILSYAAPDLNSSTTNVPCPSKATSNFTDPIVFVDDSVVKISAIFLQSSSLEGSDVKPSDISVIYICELNEIFGKFSTEKAEALGIKDRTKYGKLQKGISVKSDCLDIMVHPSDVMGPSLPGPVVFIIDCPTNSHAEELLSIQSLDGYYSDIPGRKSSNTKFVNCIIHLCPISVVNSPDYQTWMKNFGSTEHIIAGHGMRHMGAPILKSSAIIATRLNYLCSELFPSAFWSYQHHDSAAQDSIALAKDSISKLCESIPAENLMKFTLRPHIRLGLDKSNVPSLLTPSEVIDELLSDIPEVVDAAKHVSHFWHKPGYSKKDLPAMLESKVLTEEPLSEGNAPPSCLEDMRRDDLEIVFLGTGSSHPSKYRNVSSIYINLFSKGSLLLDCGEGTLAQLRRRYGMEVADNAVRNLRCIWISHIHADHHAGLTRILSLRRDLLKGVPHEPVFVIGPIQLQRFLDSYQRLEDLDMQFLDCRNTMVASWKDLESNTESHENQFVPGTPTTAENMIDRDTNSTESTSHERERDLQGCSKRLKLNTTTENGMAFRELNSLKKVLGEVGLERLISFPVVHCPESFGVVLKAAERINSVKKLIPGWKVVYSGDTRPCLEVVEASRGATLLIHEATFEDCLVGEAIARNHSTTKEAVEVGESAAAYRIILTHFSQRYPKIPSFDEIGMHKTGIAFDLMSINIADLPVLPYIVPHLKLLFKDEMTNDQSDIVDSAE